VFEFDDVSMLRKTQIRQGKTNKLCSKILKLVCFEESAEKIKHMFTSRRKYHKLLIANKYFKNIAKFEYMGTKVTNLNIAFKKKLTAIKSYFESTAFPFPFQYLTD
jgi:hypothetical protein